MKHKTSTQSVLVGSVVVVAAMCFGAGEAEANHVDCGDTIVADTTLDSDLLDCPNNGIVIGADDVTLDLNGHLIDGDGTEFAGCPDDEFCDTGLVNDGHDGVTVRVGFVREFGVGVFVGRARDNRVLGISSSKNVFFGFIVAESARSVVRNSSGNRNLDPEGDGMGLYGSHHVRIVHNSFRRNPQPGLHLIDSSDNLIKGNRFSRNAILMEESNRNRVRSNRCRRNSACVTVASGNRNVISRNRIHGGFAGIGIENGRGNVVARNIVVGPRKVGIYLGLNQPPIGRGHNVVRRNRVRDSGGDGFVVRETDSHSRLSRNVAVGADDDGFDVESRTAKLTRNRAVRNGDLGIEAVRGVIDGGGNIAGDNGDPRQCTHISCG